MEASRVWRSAHQKKKVLDDKYGSSRMAIPSEPGLPPGATTQPRRASSPPNGPAALPAPPRCGRRSTPSCACPSGCPPATPPSMTRPAHAAPPPSCVWPGQACQFLVCGDPASTSNTLSRLLTRPHWCGASPTKGSPGPLIALWAVVGLGDRLPPTSKLRQCSTMVCHFC